MALDEIIYQIQGTNFLRRDKMRRIEYAAILGWKAREVPIRAFSTKDEAERHLKELQQEKDSNGWFKNGWFQSYRVHSRVVNGAAKGIWRVVEIRKEK
jgi:hypothetical protein